MLSWPNGGIVVFEAVDALGGILPVMNYSEVPEECIHGLEQALCRLVEKLDGLRGDADHINAVSQCLTLQCTLLSGMYSAFAETPWTAELAAVTLEDGTRPLVALLEMCSDGEVRVLQSQEAVLAVCALVRDAAQFCTASTSEVWYPRNDFSALVYSTPPSKSCTARAFHLVSRNLASCM
jgi:hypothetical protein